MRDRFKFRVWDEVHYAEGLAYYVITSGGELVECDMGSDEFCTSDECCIIEQCTGLRDKNGTLIYEGDIIEYCDKLWNTHRRVVVYEKLWMQFVLEKHGCDYIMIGGQSNNGLWYDDCEVVGNIHENQELLETSHA